MAGRHENALLGEPLGGGMARVVFGRKRHESHESTARMDQPLRNIHTRRQDVLVRMGADEAGQRADKRPLHMDTDHHLTHRLVLGVQLREPVDSRCHPVEPIGDDGGEHPAATVAAHRSAGLPHRVEAQIIGIEVDALGAVELEVEGMRHGYGPSGRGVDTARVSGRRGPTHGRPILVDDDFHETLPAVSLVS